MARKCPIGQRLELLITGTKQDFAKKVGISRTQLSNVVSGRTPPSRLLLKRLASVLGANEAWLEMGKGPMESPAWERAARIPIVGRATVGVGLADEQPGDEDLITQRIEQLEAAGGVDHEMTRELLLLTARRVRELEREIADIVRTIRERGTGTAE